MVIIKTDEYAHRLKPEFIRRVVAEGWVRTRSGYEYEPLTNAEKIICRVEWR